MEFLQVIGIGKTLLGLLGSSDAAAAQRNAADSAAFLAALTLTLNRTLPAVASAAQSSVSGLSDLEVQRALTAAQTVAAFLRWQFPGGSNSAFADITAFGAERLPSVLDAAWVLWRLGVPVSTTTGSQSSIGFIQAVPWNIYRRSYYYGNSGAVWNTPEAPNDWPFKQEGPISTVEDLRNLDWIWHVAIGLPTFQVMLQLWDGIAQLMTAEQQSRASSAAAATAATAAISAAATQAAATLESYTVEADRIIAAAVSIGTDRSAALASSANTALESMQASSAALASSATVPAAETAIKQFSTAADAIDAAAQELRLQQLEAAYAAAVKELQAVGAAPPSASALYPFASAPVESAPLPPAAPPSLNWLIFAGIGLLALLARKK